MSDGTNTPGSDPLTTPTTPTTTDATSEAESPLLSLSQLKDRYGSRQKRVHIESLGADVVVRKLPAKMITDDALSEQSPMMIALTEGVADPVIDQDMINALTFEEANEIYEAVEAWNPGVLTPAESEVADKRKEFPE